jgi:hypothetical protein
MIRQIALVTVVLCMCPAWLSAQTGEFTVKTASATIHKGPSTGSPIIGKAPRGTLLEVTRELGDWVKIVWPDSEDGSGYVHLAFGTVLRSPAPSSTAASAQSAAQPVSPAGGVASSDGSGSIQASSTRGTVYVAPPTHVVGVGGLIAGSAPAFGATARIWSRRRFGVQVEVSRSAYSSVEAPRMTTMQFAPSLVYSLTDLVTDYVWVRPYVGAGVSLFRSSLSGATAEGGGSLTENSLGFRAHGGSEVTFPSVPRFAVSADVGYQKPTTPFAGYELGGLGFTLAAHWYVK